MPVMKKHDTPVPTKRVLSNDERFGSFLSCVVSRRSPDDMYFVEKLSVSISCSANVAALAFRLFGCTGLTAFLTAVLLFSVLQ